ncbi:hypothetical protein ALC57_07481 [Trachymyrmex cornetzi]|uniref:Uncharacterized protein n=1 Tax=Trachymyrmex cornetzi TaxID=471704 RepID=A0A195E529_9HYME|nr:hypothetical protein ALC57_07481 [Trachymyrmex cornetzi]
MLPLQSPDARVPGSKRLQSRPNPSDRWPLNTYNGLMSALVLSHLLRYAVSKLGFSTALNCSCKFQIFTRPSSLQLAARIPPPIFVHLANDWTAERWDYVVDWYCGGCVGKSAGRACVDQAAAGPLVW